MLLTIVDIKLVNMEFVGIIDDIRRFYVPCCAIENEMGGLDSNMSLWLIGIVPV
jgi:hypothetical protein